MHNHKVYVGIDVHRREHRVAILPVALLHKQTLNWKKAKTLVIKNNRDDFERLDAAIREEVLFPEEAVIAIDHTGGHYSEPLVYYLQGKQYSICHLEAKAVKAARERLLDEENKSDMIDAAGAAFLLYLRDTHGLSFRISAVIPELGSKASTLRCLLHQRQQYVKMITQSTNRLHHLLLAVFPEAEAHCFRKLLRVASHYPTPEDILNNPDLEGVKRIGCANRNNIVALAAQTVGAPGKLYRGLILYLVRQRNEAVAKRDEVTELIEHEVIDNPYGLILLSFPRGGVITAATIIGVLRDIDRWSNKKKLKKAFGVYGTIKESGTTTIIRKQGREGNKDARRALFQLVSRCIQKDAPENDFRDYYARQVRRGKPKLKAIISTAGKLAEIVYHCLKTRECYEYQGTYRHTV